MEELDTWVLPGLGDKKWKGILGSLSCHCRIWGRLWASSGRLGGHTFVAIGYSFVLFMLFFLTIYLFIYLFYLFILLFLPLRLR